MGCFIAVPIRQQWASKAISRTSVEWSLVKYERIFNIIATEAHHRHDGILTGGDLLKTNQLNCLTVNTGSRDWSTTNSWYPASTKIPSTHTYKPFYPAIWVIMTTQCWYIGSFLCGIPGARHGCLIVSYPSLYWPAYQPSHCSTMVIGVFIISMVVTAISRPFSSNC